MRGLTKKDNLNKVIARLPDKSFAFMIRMPSGIAGKLVGTLSFDFLAGLAKVWNADMIADGMNFVVEMANRGDIFYPLYTEAEKKADKGKRKTGMLCFLQDDRKILPSKFAIVCAGGGYSAVATMQEAFPVARDLYQKGFHVFVLQYRCGKYALAPNPMDDLARALKIIFSKENEWKIDISDYAMIGFSAGGHLVASFGTKDLGYERYMLPKPGIMILAYPVITMGKYTHAGSRNNLLGRQRRKDMIQQEKYSIEHHISKEYPKTFVWQCDSDNTVPIQNTELLAEALKSQNVPFKYETFPSDAHGWGLGIGTASEGWLERAVEFWRGGNC